MIYPWLARLPLGLAPLPCLLSCLCPSPLPASSLQAVPCA